MVCGLAARDRFDQRVLSPGQLECAVCALAFGARIEACGHYRDIGLGRELLCFRCDQVAS